MKITKLIRDMRDAIMDQERDFSERIFLCLTIASEFTVFVAFVGNLIIRENIVELFVLGSTLVFTPIITFSCLYKNRLKLAATIIVFGVVFIVLPTLFFFGGGVEGGGILWIIFAFMYAGLVISGKLRFFIFIYLTLLTIGTHIVGYCFPDLVFQHTRQMFYLDNGISVFLVGVIGFLMTWVQGILFKQENERARREAARAEELTRAQNRFFSSMSHEIRTPINSILGLNELILRDMSVSDEVVNDARGIQGAGKMLLALINDILDFSKMEAGSMDIVPVDYRVGDMLSEIVNMIWLKASEKGLKMDVSVDPSVPSALYGDEVRIKQVIVNLLNNAVKYTQEGSVGLRIDNDESGEDFVSLRISVSDTGMGIKKEALPYLFDAFKRVDQEKNRMIEGTGLGLSIVKQIVELMHGTVTVNSAYGEGSTFTVILRQGISDPAVIGELNIHNQQVVRSSAYEASFMAPEVSILIVDDNEMNLEVESKLLSETGMVIDKALSGKAALEASLKQHYDVILMDHLMPEMDGIECLEKLRQQAGGMNRTTPVVVLTANAGSENRDIYNRAGFDGYVVKPVSGAALEETLIKYISSEKLIMNNNMESMHEGINATSSYSGKAEVVITTTSMSDIPENVAKKLNLSILPFVINTDETTFKDGVQMEASELIYYIRHGKKALSDVPDETAYVEFFADNLKRAHNLIHIALTTSMSKDHHNASEAAKSFENVTVINSECVSSATGILVLIAHKMAQQSVPVDEIIAELEAVKKRLKCSFVIDTTEYMAKREYISHKVQAIATSLSLHPSLRFKDDKYGIGGIWMGSSKRAYKRYIAKALPMDVIPDSDVVFITYVDIPSETLEWIKEEISKRAYFERVIFKQASAAISSNVGPGAFGILYFVKGNKTYNIGTYFDNEEDTDEDDISEDERQPGGNEKADSRTPERDIPVTYAMPVEKKWYQKIEFIDGDVAIKNSGTEEAFRTVLKIFYDSAPSKSDEIEGYFVSEDWKNYTIKVHALKSSAKLIGAVDLADAAQLLETAGKEEDITYIREHHTSFMQDYLKTRELLADVFEENQDTPEDEAKPMADEFLLQSVYEGLKEAAEAMSSDDIEEIMNELKDYAIPEGDRDKLDMIREKAESYDYEGILRLLES